MTLADEPARGPVVTASRPPVRQSTLVRSGAQRTFGTFVTTIGTWWPVQQFSAGKDRVRDITVEQRQGGRVYETWDDGTEVDWGTLVAWDPPRRFALTWAGTPAPTEVEFTFAVIGPALTRVTVEHRGWEALTDQQLAEDCALPGGYRSGAYAAGWATILACLPGAITGADEPARFTGPRGSPDRESARRGGPLSNKAEASKQRSRRLYEEIFGKENHGLADELMAAGIVNHGPGSPLVPRPLPPTCPQARLAGPAIALEPAELGALLRRADELASVAARTRDAADPARGLAGLALAAHSIITDAASGQSCDTGQQALIVPRLTGSVLRPLANALSGRIPAGSAGPGETGMNGAADRADRGQAPGRGGFGAAGTTAAPGRLPATAAGGSGRPPGKRPRCWPAWAVPAAARRNALGARH